MNAKRFWTAAIAAALLAATGTASGQPPWDVGTAITYQGGNLTSAGALVNGLTDFEFELWDDPTVGLQYGPTLTLLDINVVDGAFTVELDFGVGPWVPNIALWLEIAVRYPAGVGSYTTLSPRQRLTPVPFSLDTRGLWVDAADRVGIGEPVPYERLHVANAELDPFDTRLYAEDVVVEDLTAWLGLYSSDEGEGAGITFAKVIGANMTNKWNIFRNEDPNESFLDVTYGNPVNPFTCPLRMRIEQGGHTLLAPNGGHVGIGFNYDPLARLHVQRRELPGTADYQAWYEDDILATDNVTWMALFGKNEGNIGVGITLAEITDDPADYNKWGVHRRPSIHGGDFNITYGLNVHVNTNDTMLRILTDGTTVLTPEYGQVGIGVDEPTAKLHVRNDELPGASDFQAGYENDIHVEAGKAWLGLYSDDGGGEGVGSGITFAEIASDPADNNKWSIYRRVSGNIGDLNFTFGPDSNPGANEKVMQLRQDLTARFHGNVQLLDPDTDEIVMELGTGLDYAEGFDVTDSDSVVPGCVLVIDPDHAGELTISTAACDTKVAGIVAGAKGQGSGVRLGAGLFEHDVALAGRVYCNVDTTYGAVQPGDLLTTSPTPGYAMVVKDRAKAQGAILGKAMEALAEGQRGQILVLVTLQ